MDIQDILFLLSVFLYLLHFASVLAVLITSR